MKKRDNMQLIKGIVLVIWLVVLLITLDGIGHRLKALEQEVKTLKQENSELWKNIDALSEDYTQLYQEVYKEVE